MNLSTLLFAELRHRCASSLVLLLSLSLAVAASISLLGLINGYEQRATQSIANKEAQTKERMKKMEDDYRKITKKLGFNILILPKGQDLGAYYADDDQNVFMPESYVHTLANSKIVTVQHLLPLLKKKVSWTERKRKVLLIGVRDEVPIAHRDPKKPLLHPVPPGHIALGFELHNSLDIKTGDEIQLLDTTFKVHACHKERGSKDDVSLWLDLSDAQLLLDKPKLINGIMALECKCAFANLAKVRKEIQGILPDTQVIEFQSQALARAEARQTAAKVAKESLAHERAHAEQQVTERYAMAAIVIPVIFGVCALIMILIIINQVRERTYEIGVLRAIGLKDASVLFLLLSKFLIIGFAAAMCGLIIALVCLQFISNFAISSLIDPLTVGLICLSAPVLSIASAWLPTLKATHSDVAALLRAE